MASRPARSFTAALGIGVGIATVLSVQVVDHNTILTQRKLAAVESLAEPDVEIRPLAAGVPQGGAAPLDLARDDDVAAFCGVFYGHAEIVRDDDAAPESGPADAKGKSKAKAKGAVDVTVIAVGPLAAEEFGAYAVTEGRDFSGARAAELLLPERTAAALGLGVGDRLALRRSVPLRQGCLDGKLVTIKAEGESPAGEPGLPREFEVVGVLAPHHVGLQPAVVLPFESAAELFRDAHVQATYWGRLRNGAVWQDVAQRLKESWSVAKPKGALVGERIDQMAFRKSLGITSCLALLLGLFVIYNAFSLALVERVREIGLLRALGLTRGEIVRAVLLEGLLLATLGALLGAVLSAGLVGLMNALSITTLGAGKPLQILDVPWGLALGVVALGMLFALLGMTAPLLRARHLSVLEALRAGRLALRADPGFALRAGLLLGVPLLIPLFFTLVTPPLGERQHAVHGLVLELAGVVAGFFLLLLAFPRPLHACVELVLRLGFRVAPVEARLAAAAVRGARQRVLTTITGLAVVVAAVFVVRAVNDGFLDEIGRFSHVAMDGRVYVRTRALSREEAAAALAVDGVARIESLSAEVMTPFPLRGMRAADLRAQQARAGLSDAEVDEFARGDSLLISKFLAAQMGFRAGDPFTLATFGGPRTLRVGAITDRVGYWPDDRSFALLEMARMEQLFCVDDAQGKHFVLEVRSGAGESPAAIAARAADVERALSDKLPPAPDRLVRSAATIQEYYLRDGRRDFYVFDVILWSTAALAAVGLLNSLAIALLERQREIGLLRTLGLTARQVGRMLLLEALAIGVVGGVLAALLAAPASRLVLEAVRVISRLDLKFRFEPAILLAPFVAAVAIALVAALWPALRGGKLDLGPLHRHE